MTGLTRAEAYELRIGRWSRLVGRKFLDWLAPVPGLDWLDVGCGSGALSDAVLEHSAPKSLVGIDPQEGVASDRDAAHSDPRADFRCIDAQDMPFDNDAFDMAVSGLVINFIENQPKALSEMKRVLRPGGLVAAYVWDFAGRMELFSIYWGAARALDPGAAKYDHGELYPLCKPEPLRALFATAGFENVEISEIEIAMPYGDFNDFWQPLLIGSGGIPDYARSLSADALAAFEAKVRGAVPARPDGGFTLKGRAWAVRGQVPVEQ